ncbi:RagB/SusD family nutrient uptake outer membrane protein [Chitinophaga sp. Mgbs1]|uniref:RagB/SusD family nutrient uptake outer membrane protein n=1 Tax=Chitinophaga solisilvae TaxID=1233460 RepID=A0A433WMM7_9BACT|nr:RagB/SusD family nutrient uptake outer membrane protein [Chitinophaga solisilvae]
MKKLLYIFAVTGMMITASCSKNFLQIDPQQQTDASLVIQDLPGTRAAITGIYSLMQSINGYGRTTTLLPDLMSDNVYISKKNQGRYLAYDQYNTVATDGYAASQWNQLYRVVANTNLLISKAEKVDYPVADQAEARHIMGEAYALRAMAHFDLVRFYAMPYNFTTAADHTGVPVVLKSGTNKDEIQSPSRNKVKEVYDQVIADFSKAISLLPKTPVGFKTAMRGRMSHYAAKALLARVQLYREDWVAADTLAADVITNGYYTLLSRSQYIEDGRKLNNAESIFELQYNLLDNPGSDALANFYWQSGSYGDALASENLYNAYASTDIRRGYITKGKRKDGEDPAMLVLKYINNTSFEEPVKVIRLAEMYLIRAEARQHQGLDAAAAQDLNTIATRADASWTPTAATGAALQALILDENRKEFAFEGHRLFDLTRNKLTFTKYRSGTNTIAIQPGNGKTILPIPQSEMNANKNMEQNEAYKIK